MIDKDLKRVAFIDSHGRHNQTIEILASATPSIEASDELKRVLNKAIWMIQEQIIRDQIAADPKMQEQAIQEKEKLLGTFGDHLVDYKPIPNGYCNNACCSHLPWFIIWTKVGQFMIGWRKRVIEISWNACVDSSNAKDLFPNEEVTRFEKTIHAWSYEKAAEYINVVIKSLKAA